VLDQQPHHRLVPLQFEPIQKVASLFANTRNRSPKRHVRIVTKEKDSSLLAPVGLPLVKRNNLLELGLLPKQGLQRGLDTVAVVVRVVPEVPVVPVVMEMVVEHDDGPGAWNLEMMGEVASQLDVIGVAGI
jgi:hypothetical protein